MSRFNPNVLLTIATHVDVDQYDPLETFTAANHRRPTVDELAQYIAYIRVAEAKALYLALEDAANPEPEDPK